MKNLRFYKMHIRQRIQTSADVERVRFGFSICMRLLTDYKSIAEQGYLPDIEVLEKATQLFDRYIEFQFLNQDDTLQLVNQVDLISPVTENLSQSETSCVLNTITSIYELLLYLGDHDYNHLETISDLLIKTVEFRILDSYDQISYEAIDDHPVFINELKYQLELFNGSNL